jgi:hypothetical protein
MSTNNQMYVKTLAKVCRKKSIETALKSMSKTSKSVTAYEVCQIKPDFSDARALGCGSAGGKEERSLIVDLKRHTPILRGTTPGPPGD